MKRQQATNEQTSQLGQRKRSVLTPGHAGTLTVALQAVRALPVEGSTTACAGDTTTDRTNVCKAVSLKRQQAFTDLRLVICCWYIIWHPLGILAGQHPATQELTGLA